MTKHWSEESWHKERTSTLEKRRRTEAMERVRSTIFVRVELLFEIVFGFKSQHCCCRHRQASSSLCDPI